MIDFKWNRVAITLLKPQKLESYVNGVTDLHRTLARSDTAYKTWVNDRETWVIEYEKTKALLFAALYLEQEGERK